MPIVLRLKGYRFGFYASDSYEPPHVRVKRNGNHAKFWLWPVIEMDFNQRYRRHELNEIRRLIAGNRAKLLEAWREFFGVGH